MKQWLMGLFLTGFSTAAAAQNKTPDFSPDLYDKIADFKVTSISKLKSGREQYQIDAEDTATNRKLTLFLTNANGDSVLEKSEVDIVELSKIDKKKKVMTRFSAVAATVNKDEWDVAETPYRYDPKKKEYVASDNTVMTTTVKNGFELLKL